MQYSAIDFNIEDQIATITLNRPSAANSMNLELAKELMQAALFCEESKDVRAVIITGSGSIFSVGGDLRSFTQHGDQVVAHIKEVTTYFHSAIARFAHMDAPVIAAVNGVAAGGGMSLAIACDMVIAAESARFTMAYTKIGLTPDLAGSYFLPKIVGHRRALELTLTNRVLSAQEAFEWGIANQVVPDSEIHSAAKNLAAQLAVGPTGAFGASKRLLYAGWDQTLETHLLMESQLIASRAYSTEGIEGISAFLEKRKPNF